MKSRHATLAAALVGQGSASPVKRRVPAPLGEAPGILGVPAGEVTVRVQTAMVELSAKAQSLRDELERARKRIAHLEKLADRDTLTPVLNRRAFLRELARVLSFGERYGLAGSLLYFDVNGLKQINDVYGHMAGDRALIQVRDLMLDLYLGS